MSVRFRFRPEKVARMHVHERHSVSITDYVAPAFPKLSVGHEKVLSE